jgi:hypothetical protein
VPRFPPGWAETPPSFSAHQLWGSIPGEDWQIDFTHMPAHKKLKYLLTLVDTFLDGLGLFLLQVSQQT